MADKPKQNEQQSTATQTKRPAGTRRPSEPGDPEVHSLLARRQIAEQNDDQDQLNDIAARLREMGYDE